MLVWIIVGEFMDSRAGNKTVLPLLFTRGLPFDRTCLPKLLAGVKALKHHHVSHK